MGELVGYIPSTNNMERLIKALFVLYIVSFIVSAREEEHKKAISIFNVVKFKNDVCAGGGNQNGTCYTAEECSAIDGTASGTFTQDRGACITDTFTASSSAGAVPVICGTNTGQHMIVDSDGETCSTASFTFGGTATNRAYDIKVLQFDCKNEMGGPTGCLQYFSTDMGTFSSFNYGGVPENPDMSGAHLANQNYNVGTNCATDYLEILGLETQANVAIAITTQALATAYTSTLGKICGMGFDAAGAAQAANNIPTSVCTGVTPFNVRFVSDAGEVADDVAVKIPTGHLGFSLNYVQQDC